jgi:hypothetical protein
MKIIYIKTIFEHLGIILYNYVIFAKVIPFILLLHIDQGYKQNLPKETTFVTLRQMYGPLYQKKFLLE